MFLGLLVIVSIDHPFTGPTHIDSDPLYTVLEDFGGGKGSDDRALRAHRRTTGAGALIRSAPPFDDPAADQCRHRTARCSDARHRAHSRGAILEVQPGISSAPAALDLDGDYLLPGAVDLHTDNLERQVQPRAGTRWPSRSALLAHDAQCAAAGVTTVLDALCVGDLGF
ncbi:MAG: hypothetical protein WDN04_20375 [Rhodospirillales bacterium]